MKPLHERIAAVEAEIREFLAIAENATPGPWEFVDSLSNQTVQGKGRPVCALATMSSRDDDFIFIARSRNISPVMAECLLGQISAMNELNRNAIEPGELWITRFCQRKLTSICDQWEKAKK
jgi:hypothetical protein